MDRLVEEGKLVAKLFKKNKIYLPNQVRRARCSIATWHISLAGCVPRTKPGRAGCHGCEYQAGLTSACLSVVTCNQMTDDGKQAETEVKQLEAGSFVVVLAR